MTKTAKVKRIPVAAVAPTRLDLGCGINKAPGCSGVDSRPFEGVDIVLDLTAKENDEFVTWPWDDNSVEFVHSSHFVEHLDADERIHFVNELYRILKPGGQASLVVPHWASCRAYGDLTHKWPPVSEFWFYYLKKEWRDANAPHNDFYTCDFEVTWGYNLHQELLVRNQEYQTFAMTFYKEAAQDIVATLTKNNA